MVSQEGFEPVFFRPGEVTLLFNGNANLEGLQAALEEANIPIDRISPFTGPAGPRAPVVLQSREQVTGTLQTVNLTTRGAASPPAAALQQVTDVVRQLNNTGLPRFGASFLAASPNWLGIPFQ